MRRALHVGGLCLHDSAHVEQYLEVEMMRNIKPWIEKVRIIISADFQGMIDLQSMLKQGKKYLNG